MKTIEGNFLFVIDVSSPTTRFHVIDLDAYSTPIRVFSGYVRFMKEVKLSYNELSIFNFNGYLTLRDERALQLYKDTFGETLSPVYYMSRGGISAKENSSGTLS